MKLLKEHRALIIENVQQTKRCTHHSSVYYEIVYVNNGSGIHTFNNNSIPFFDGDIIIICIGEKHDFVIELPSNFTYIRFTENYFDSRHHSNAFKSIFNLHGLNEIKIAQIEQGKTTLCKIMESIVFYSAQTDALNSQVIFYLLLSVLALIKETLQVSSAPINETMPNTEQISTYIHEHIYDRDKIIINNIAAHFDISPAYFSSFFKRTFEVSYRKYLNQCRLKLIEKKIETGNLKFKQIAKEFGFKDASNFANSFKKQKGVSPKSYSKLIRKNKVALPSQLG